jgi:ribose/xylose/arabinose/galactoside ABC-type transport system permease subunit
MEEEQDNMMGRVWLAAVLGVLLGVAIAYTNAVPVISPAGTNLTARPFEAQMRPGQTTKPPQPDLQLLLISLLIGITVAAPIFLVAKKRT